MAANLKVQSYCTEKDSDWQLPIILSYEIPKNAHKNA